MTVTRHHFDWNHTRAFLAAAEEGSLSAAARALGLSQPTLSRQVSALEEELGVTLFERTGRQLTLTESGLALLNYAKSMGDAAVSLSNAATGQDDRLEGTVCISTTELVAAHIMPDILRSLHAAAPGITLELVASNQASDLRRREADIAIRTFRPQQPDFIARQLTPAQGALFASRQYIQEFGDLQTSASLSQARFIAWDQPETMIRLLADHGIRVNRQQFPFISTNRLVQWEMIRAGLGIGVMPTDIASSHPELVPVRPDLVLFSGELWLVTHREFRTNRRIQFVFRFLHEQLEAYSLRTGNTHRSAPA